MKLSDLPEHYQRQILEQEALKHVSLTITASPSDFYEKKGSGQSKTRLRPSSRPLLNRLESRYCDHLAAKIYPLKVMEQSITLALDPPFRSYRPDLAVVDSTGALYFWEVKGPHRFREKGIAKAALAAKTYPMFKFYLCEWHQGEWKETLL